VAEAAFAAVAAVALFAAASTLPFPFNPALLVCSVPFVLVGIRHGAGLGSLMVAFAAAVLGAARIPGALDFVLLSGAPGLVLGVSMRRNVGPEWTIGLGAAALCASLGLGLVIRAGGIEGIGLAYRREVTGLGAWLLEVQQFFEALGSAGDLAGFPEMIAGLRGLVARALPGLVGAGAVLFSASVSGLAMALAARTVGSATPAFTWILPEGWIWAFIGAAGAGLTPWGPWRTIGLNVLLVLLALYLLQGISIAGFWLRRLELPWYVRSLAVLVVMLLPPLTVLVLAILTGVGLCDVWVSFRRLDAPRSP
jgi:uncharacterized protein YybS (DUF2232 family)